MLLLAGCATTPESRTPDLRERLLSMRTRDQQARQQLFAGGKMPTEEEAAKLLEVDRVHSEALLAILDELGHWPGRSLVGEDGAEAAWLLAQHADHHPTLQEQALPLLEAAVSAGEADPVHLAYLQDRVLVRRGLPQRYGTQSVVEDGRVRLHPIEDEAEVGARRAALGLPPLEIYLRQLEEMVGGGR